MHFVQCPRCGDVIELPPDSVGTNRSDPWNVAGCDECDLIFDYGDEEVQHAPGIDGVL